ncbi:MAG: 4-(cytidine 5'-diphospho)-2-C-methyl-D-erythritol kinase [Polaromonas sp.]|nr:4-(cytidine 5'-diphospho)-2-C-methyl-D-erythritol kinase [Polaromonas sp.]
MTAPATLLQPYANPPARSGRVGPLSALYDVAAPAKLNAFLHITGRRPDGYHLLQSVFVLIDWYDTLNFELRTDGGISREDLHEPAADAASVEALLPADDLSVRAAKALQRASGTALGVHIGLRKRIPAQAGMGGGSSDAASCLLALQRLWQVSLPPAQLQALALSLGADVPFFLAGGPAWVEGIGDIVERMRLPSARFVVLKPISGVSTAEIFSSSDLKRDAPAATMRGFSENDGDGDFPGVNSIWKFGRNDLQPVAQKLCPQIDQALAWLSAQQLEGRMTGSGSAVFAPLPSDKILRVAPPGCALRICGSLESHPLAGW